MHKKTIYLSLILAMSLFFTSPKSAHAVIPPDFIFNIGTQIAQFFSLIAFAFTLIFGTLFQFFKTRFYRLKYRKTVLFLILLTLVVLSLVLASFYATYQQKQEYQKWLDESALHETQSTSSQEATIDTTDPENPKTQETPSVLDENDRLHIGNTALDTSSNRFVSKVNLSDPSAKFINDYYKNIANGNLTQAYAMSKKSVNYQTFASWYAKTDKITLDNLVRIDAKKSSVELTLYEGTSFTKYGVLMTLAPDNAPPKKIENSEVKILSQGLIGNKEVLPNTQNLSQEYQFFSDNENKSIVITNEEFKKVTESNVNNFIVLDAREDIENENGSFPGSLHIRFADLKAGRWIELPKDTFVYVLCWSGIRGKEVTEFLRTKKVVASYLQNGANGWVEFGGKWIGDIKFGEKYTDIRYQKVFTTEETKKKAREDVTLVDTREPYKFNKSHIPGSVNIPIMYTPTTDLEKTFAQVPPKSSVITVCDGYVNCFDAKITGVELERRGHPFLGRYNKPWEYEK